MANTSLLKPTSIEVALSENNPNRAVITLEPFERGYGHTLGNALRRSVNLVFPDCFARGENLAVDIRQANLVVIDKVNRPYSAADKRLNGVAADAAYPENGNACRRQSFHCFFAEQKLRS